MSIMKERLTMLTQNVILENVEKQLAEWTPEKYGWKRKPHKALMRMFNFFSYITFGRRKWNLDQGNMELGIDEFGRSVFDGMQMYVNILKRRGIKFNTILVQGSRAKGRWKPTSDIDVTIISEDFPRKNVYTQDFPRFMRKIFGFRRWFMLSDIPLGMGVEPSFCCNTKDFMQMLENFDIHALDAIHYGKIIYDDGFWQEARDRFREIETKYELDKTDLKRMLLVV
jgi:hypothetical protein